MKTFRSCVLDWVRKISRGEVASYGEIAILAGSPGAARAVGNLMKKNRDPEIPCHRVICSNGKIGGYNGNLGKKIDLLQKEGVRIKNEKVVDSRASAAGTFSLEKLRSA